MYCSVSSVRRSCWGAAATYYDYGTRQSKTVHASGDTLNIYGTAISEVFVNGSMNASFYVDSNGGPYLSFDYFEYQAIVAVHYSATVRVDVGYTYGGQSYTVLSHGSPPLNIQQVNSTTIEYQIGTAGTQETWAVLEIDVVSNQFSPPSPAQNYWCGVIADNTGSYVQMTTC